MTIFNFLKFRSISSYLEVKRLDNDEENLECTYENIDFISPTEKKEMDSKIDVLKRDLNDRDTQI